MDNYLDYKATVWFRIPIQSEEALQKVKQKIEEGLYPSELYDEFTRHELGQCEILYETEEFMIPDENDGQSTIELYSIRDNGNEECIWDNSLSTEG